MYVVVKNMNGTADVYDADALHHINGSVRRLLCRDIWRELHREKIREILMFTGLFEAQRCAAEYSVSGRSLEESTVEDAKQMAVDYAEAVE